MSSHPNEIKALHDTYCAISRMPVALRFNRESSWVDFIRAGFTKTDLEAVLNRLVRMVEQGERRPECLKFSNTIEQPDRFEEELAMIKAEENGLHVKERTLSIQEFDKVFAAKRERMRHLSECYASEDAFGLNWFNPNAQSEYNQLRRECRELTWRISKMA